MQARLCGVRLYPFGRCNPADRSTVCTSACVVLPWRFSALSMSCSAADISLAAAGLMSEALALVDLLVLVRAQRFAGFFVSSYSWVVQARSLVAHGYFAVAVNP